MKKSTIVCAAFLAVTVIVMAVLIIVGINRNSNKPENPVETTGQTETVTPEDTEAPGTSETNPPVVVPPVEDHNPTEGSSATVDLDVGDMTKNPEPEVVSGSVEYESKD